MNNKKEFLVFDKDEQLHEYTITKKERKDDTFKYVMKRSMAEHWTENVRGEKMFTIIDNDGDVEIKPHDCTIQEMAYHQLIELGVLIMFINEQTHIPSRFEIIEK